MSYIAEVAGVEIPTFKAIIHIAIILNETNYWEVGMALKKLGLENMSIEEMLKFVNTGSI